MDKLFTLFGLLNVFILTAGTGAMMESCAHGRVTLETARVGACLETEQYWENQCDPDPETTECRGEMSKEDAFARIDATREVCDVMKAVIREQ